MAYRDTDFMYASARVSAFETKLLTKEKYMQIIDAATEKDAVALLGESVAPVAVDGAFDIEATLEKFIADAFSEVAKSISEPKLFDFMRYEYDANNLKAAIKAHFIGADTDGMLFACGTLPPEAAEGAVQNGDFSAFPKHMAKAAAEALETYAATRDPQSVDLLIDRAAFADMADGAAADTLLLDAVRARIDAINTVAAIRMIDAGKPDRIKPMLLAGGKIPLETFAASDREALHAALAEKDAATANLLSDGNAALGDIERAVDKAATDRPEKAKFAPFGLPKLYAYLSAVQTQAKNLRIIFALRAAHADKETIRAKIRVN